MTGITEMNLTEVKKLVGIENLYYMKVVKTGVLCRRVLRVFASPDPTQLLATVQFELQDGWRITLKDVNASDFCVLAKP